MFVVALVFMVANTILAAFLVRRTLRQRHNLDTVLSGFAGVIQRLGSGAFIWQLCAIYETVLFLWIPLPPAIAPYWSGIGAACLLVFGVAWWLTQRAFPASASQTAMNGILGIALALGSLYETDSLRKAVFSGWWSLLIGAGILSLEGLFILVLSVQRERAMRRAQAARQSPN